MRPFSTDADALVCLNNREFVVSALQGDDEGGPFRVDGREPHETRVRRQLSIKLGPVEGVCVVRLGNTIACASTTGALEKPTSGERRRRGRCAWMWISRAGVRRVRQGRESVAENSTARPRFGRSARARVERSARGGRGVAVRAGGEASVVITCSVTSAAHDGNLAGAASLAACGSLMTSADDRSARWIRTVGW